MVLTARRFIVAACLPAAWFVPSAQALDVTGYALLTSDYVFRGVSYSDDHAAAQGGVDLALDSGLYAGVWASTVDIERAVSARDVEVNYYAGYNHELNADWTIGANVVQYTYPGAEGPIDYDFREYSLIANFRDRAWLEYSYSPDLFHTSQATQNVEIYAEWPVASNFLLGAGAGYYDVSELSGTGYGHWQVGITRPFRRFSLDLRYHDTNRDVPILSDPDSAESRVVLSLRIPFRIR